MNIRYARESDKQIILNIAHQYSKQLGYVHPIGLLNHIKNNTVLVAESGGNIVGFVDWHSPKRGKNKDFNVIYHLAVDKNHCRKNIGKALLYSVECPIRLRCTEDNDTANNFYKSCGMYLADTESGKKRRLFVWELKILSILIRGNSKIAPSVAKETGWAYGSRHNNKIHDWPFMIDIDWQNYEWDKYMSLIEKHHPVQAMVADYESEEQKELMLKQVSDLRNAGVIRILVCPKFDGAIKDIPNDCVIAVSVPTRSTKYSGFLPRYSELTGKKIHLLGGSPQTQSKIIRQIHAYGGIVISQDSNSHMDERRVSSIFVSSGKWVSIKERLDIKERSILSGVNIRKHLNNVIYQEQLLLLRSE